MKYFILLFAFFAFNSFLTVNVRAETWTVTKTADTDDSICDADCSLREAIARAGSSRDTIVFSELFNAEQTITLGGTELLINKNLTITGPGAALLTISGNNLTRVIRVMGGFNVTLSGLTITKGNATAYNGQFDGAGLYNDGNLTVDSCVIKNNAASGSGA